MLEFQKRESSSGMRENSQVFNSNVMKYKCKCNKIGHIQKYCRSRYQNVNYPQYQGNVSRSQNFENPRYQGNGSRTHVAGQSSVEENKHTFHVEVMNTETEMQHDEEGKIKWLVNSGCSDHIINTDKYF